VERRIRPTVVDATRRAAPIRSGGTGGRWSAPVRPHPDLRVARADEPRTSQAPPESPGPMAVVPERSGAEQKRVRRLFTGLADECVPVPRPGRRGRRPSSERQKRTIELRAHHTDEHENDRRHSSRDHLMPPTRMRNSRVFEGRPSRCLRPSA
jgi:hypothetical protein